MNEGRYPTDWAVWADHWDLVEGHGMNVEAVPALAAQLRDPVLLVGSGQGLVAASLSSAGFHVVAVDSSATMARRARERRGVETVLCDVVDLRLGRRFATALVSTGVVNERSIAAGLVPRLVEVLRAHLLPDGVVLIAYFRRSAWTGVAELLGLYDRPSTNAFFWVAGGDVERARQLFTDRSADPEAVGLAFSRHGEALARHADFIRRVGERCERLGSVDPEGFIRDHAGFYPFPLSTAAEVSLLAELGAGGLVPRGEALLNGADTRVVVLGVGP
ncbi:class I SAM-dependent methyltransferase [Cellulomonas endophytica]|uniref:class I SAM-dependent methyltransferase n=1 Tax=Cellulomonas endophytica TaxID=2494735 RepID=UPI001010D4E7|nr:methyltransferase domain-containing protein [Cellulomonas endophytica]